MPTFRSECILNASPQALFEFHNNPANLMKVMPPTSRLVELRADESAVEGGVIELHMREFGILPMRWKCRWKRVEPPHLLVDEMVEGPFQSFVHYHRFESMDKMRTRMVDEIHYTMRGGWPGHVFSITFFRIYLMMMFAWRKMKMRKLFGTQNTP